MPDAPTITLEDSGTKGRYIATLPGRSEVAELTYSRVNPGLIIADHTGVPDSLRGTGIGQALVEHLVAEARAKGFKVIPLCPFVKAQRARHPDWHDVFQG